MLAWEGKGAFKTRLVDKEMSEQLTNLKDVSVNSPLETVKGQD